MLRTNLATRPFYNERAAHFVIGIAAAIVLAITALNLTRVVSLSRHHTELSSHADADRAEAQRLTGEAARIRKTINKDELALVVAAAQEANVLIDQRTFSWTEFFNQIESTLPPDVMLTSVRPSFKAGVTHVAMSVLARQAPDLEEFMDKLEATGSFSHVVLASEDRTDEGLFRALIESAYTRPDRADAEPTSPPPAPVAGTPGAARSTGAPPAAAPRAAKPQRGGGRQ
jgi:Tfp pilus assembly protein PilN